MGWTCPEIRPGITDCPWRLIFWVPGPAVFSTSVFVPAATNRSPRIATACTFGYRSHMVMMSPLKYIVSAFGGLSAAKQNGRLRTHKEHMIMWRKDKIDRLLTLYLPFLVC